MIYKDFQNLRLPMLGFGSMRLPLLPGGGDGDVDEAAVAEMVALAMERGANYFDTAYGYHNGNSERVMGRVLSRYPRESWLLASKFPGYDVSNIRPDRVEAIFEEQLEKCGVDYFDFYLFHNVYERNVGPYLDPDNRVLEYLLRQKEAGRIRHLGFSAHGSLAVIQRFLDAYGEYMEFGQLQLNYLDWDFQGTRAAAGVPHPRMGDGAPAGRAAGQAVRRGRRPPGRPAAGGEHAGLGLPLPPGGARRDYGALRHVQPGAAAGQPGHLRNRPASE